MSELGLKPATLGARLRASAKSAAHKKEQVPAVVGAGDDISRIKQCMPKVVGCTLHILPKHKAFTAFYPGSMPGSRTRTWGWRFTKSQVLRAVIEWSWTEHFRKTGEKCSFDLQLINI